jgi:hypothetical protein
LKHLLAFLLLLTFPLLSRADELIVSGIYNGQNPLVQNPMISKGVYCTEDVYVNHRKVMSGIASSAYEINLSFLRINDSVNIIIHHQAGCVPKIINPQALRPSQTFRFVAMNIYPQQLKWTALGEKSQDSYAVQYFVNGNWATLQSFKPTGLGIYMVPLRHSQGMNRYRVRYSELDGRIFYSKEQEYFVKPVSNSAPVTFYPKSVTDKIFLSREYPYQILSPNGKVIKKGKSKEIMLLGLRSGIYYLALDKRRERFFKK